ncbi:hypothetical protein C3433_25825 [Citrobacter freundii]|nr:hypothetical protein C3433_25825 [Citrobacter freundii]
MRHGEAGMVYLIDKRIKYRIEDGSINITSAIQIHNTIVSYCNNEHYNVNREILASRKPNRRHKKYPDIFYLTMKRVQSTPFRKIQLHLQRRKNVSGAIM